MSGVAQCKLLHVDSARNDLNYTFRFNPSSIRRGVASEYADVPLALYNAGPTDAGVPFQWTRNRPTTIDLEFVLHDETERGDVEKDIDALERLTRVDSRTGEPPSMLWVEGERRDTVRVQSIDWDVRLWTPQLKRKFVNGRLSMRVLRPYQPR